MTTYRLRRPAPERRPAPVLDEHQRAVVDHPGGPLLVLAGPGTGKTTTLVEAVVDRVEGRGVDPSAVLALTFSRKAAEQLRDRVTARLGRTVESLPSATFHAFAFSLVREFAPAELYAGPLRLLSAPEQDVVLAELLRDPAEADRWPASLQRAVGTRGFAREVGAVLSRAREKGLDPDGLAALGAAERVPEWEAAGLFMESYLANLDAQSATDYADLVRRACLEASAHRDELRARWSHVFVDEYQDTDPGQVALLHEIAGDGRHLTAVGDPHQSIYGFRGAEVRGILDFPAQFPRRDGRPADVVVLRTTRRFGPRILTASQRVASRIGLSGSIGAAAREAFLEPQVAPDTPPGRVDVLTFDTDRAETEHLADLLRRAHLEDGVAWGRMAVLVRSARTTVPGLRRALLTAGVPVEVAGDETPLVHETAVAVLLDALEAARQLAAGGGDADHPALPSEAAEALLTSPLCGLDAPGLRSLARALRAADRAAVAVGERERVRPSADLLRDALVDPELLQPVARQTSSAGIAARAAGDLARRLHEGGRGLVDGASVEDTLWALWSGSSWPERLRRTSERGGRAARHAHRDLDAVVALFATVGRAEEQRGSAGVANVLATLRAQQIPADTLAEEGVRGDAVRLLTAHRAKGLEWDLVVVAHVQEGVWPDVRRRATLLAADRIGLDRSGVPELHAPTTTRELLAEERRLFYVACTRARHRLVVTAVASRQDDGETPSRFLAEIAPPGAGAQVRHIQGRPRRPLSLAGLVAELRRTAADQSASPALRAAAARRLSGLAQAGVRGADPSTWWGTLDTSHAPRPLRAPETAVELSASALSGLVECPLRWFLEREAGGSRASTSAQGFGSVVHALADRVARGELVADTADLDQAVEELMVHVDRVWDQLAFRTPWSQERERDAVRTALARYLAWHRRPGGRRLLATEQSLRATVTLSDGTEVVVRGFADRLEIDDQGAVVVVDLKTGKSKVTVADLAEHPQLGVYSTAVAAGAVDALLEEPARAGGAELWQLRAGSGPLPAVQEQGAPEPDASGRTVVELQLADAVTAIREETFVARPSTACRHCSFAATCPATGTGTVLS